METICGLTKEDLDESVVVFSVFGVVTSVLVLGVVGSVLVLVEVIGACVVPDVGPVGTSGISKHSTLIGLSKQVTVTNFFICNWFDFD